ncbi:MAG: hypothetical protein JHC33_08405, partial [Ignisphaera sp.]|nr:hypothetical protein [Ignisphaera sp.]
MSFLLGFGQSILSGLSSIASGLVSSVSGVANDINNAFASLANFLQQLPSDAQQFFQSIAGAIIAFGHAIGSYLLNGFQWLGNAISSAFVPVERGLEWLGSTILNALNTLWNDIKSFASNVYSWVTSAISNVYNIVQGIVNDIKNTAITIYNFLTNIMSDAYNVFTNIFNSFFDFPKFFSQISNYFSSIFGGSNLFSAVPSLVASEASRIATALPDVIAYNTFMEMMPRIISGIANSPVFGDSIKGAFAKSILLFASPIISAFVSMFTKSIMDNLFTPAQTTQIVERPSTPQLQSFTSAPSVQLPQRSPPTVNINNIGQLQAPDLTFSQIELDIERPNVTGVFVGDVIGIGTADGGTVELILGTVNFQGEIQKFSDSTAITPAFSMTASQTSSNNT